MANKKTTVFINNGGNAEKAIALDGAKPFKTKALPNVKYVFKGEGEGAPEDATLTRVGRDRIGGGDIVSLADGESSAIAWSGDAGSVGSMTEGGPAISPWWLGGGLALVGGAAAAMGGGGSSSSSVAVPVSDAPPAAKDLLSDGGKGVPDVQADPVDKTSESSDPFEFKVDTTKPDASEFAILAVEGDTGESTDDNHPTINGIGTPGDTVIVVVRDSRGDHEVGRTTVDESGNWSLSVTTPLASGNNEFTAIAMDAAGVKTESAPYAMVIDVTESSVPVVEIPLAIIAVVDDRGVTGNIEHGGTTDDVRPEIQGTAEAGSIITLYDRNHGFPTQLLGSVQADMDGKWSFTPTEALMPRAHSILAMGTNPAGEPISTVGTWNFVVDAVPEPKPISDVPVIDNVLGDWNYMQKGDVTADATPTLIGTAPAGSIVKIYDGASLLGSVQASASGRWIFTPTEALKDGAHDITATATNSAGQTSAATGIWNFVVDTATSAPEPQPEPTPEPVPQPEPEPVSEVPVIESALDDTGSWHYTQKGEVITDDKPTFGGTAPAGSIVKIYDGATLLGSVQADAGNRWSFTPSDALEDGAHEIAATATNSAGQTSAAADSWNFVVDTKAPDAVSDLVVTDDVGATTGLLFSGDTTDDNTPTFAGKAEPGGRVSVYDNGIIIGEVMTDENGDWSFTPDLALLADGDHAFFTTATDDWGNVSEPSEVVNVKIDTRDVPVVIDYLWDDQGAQGHIERNGVTDDARPELHGRGKAGSIVTVYDGADVLGTTQVNGDGTWSFTPAADLDAGDHSITVVDNAGLSAPSQPFEFVVDTTTPSGPLRISAVVDDQGALKYDVANGGVTDDVYPEIQGTAPARSIIKVYEGNGSPGSPPQLLGSVQADGDGKWSFTPTEALEPGEHRIMAIPTNSAGEAIGTGDVRNFLIDLIESGWINDPVVSDLVLTDYVGAIAGKAEPGSKVQPPLPVIQKVRDDLGIPRDLQTGETTDDARPTISGRAPVGTIVSIYDGDILLGSVQTRLDASWTFTPADALEDGAHSITVTATNSLGQTSDATGSWDFVVDTKAPGAVGAAPVIESVLDDVGVAHFMEKGEVTDDARPTFIGTAAGGSIVKIYETAGFIHLLGSVQADADGDWSFTPTDALANGRHNFTVMVIDPETQANEATDVWDFVVDTRALDAASAADVGGIDTLVMDAKDMHIDLSSLGLQGIEKFDLGTGGNTLALGAKDVLANGQTDLALADGKTQMMINGANGEVDLLGGNSGPDGWASGGATQVDGVTYNVYTNLACTSELLVEDKVHVMFL